MTPHQQLFGHDPENGVYGDCWRTCIASILNLPVTDVPHVHSGEHGACKAAMMSFLASRGLTVAAVPFHASVGLEGVQTMMKAVNPGVHYMLLGKGGHASGCNHIVICRDGEVIHDTSGSGIIGPAEGEDGPLYWLEFLVPLSPDPVRVSQ